MKKSRIKLSQGGITLVALVVTIVVLLILAGITITMLFSDNGIIKRAQEAKNAWENGEAKDEEGMKNLEEVLNHYANGGNAASGTEEGFNKTKGVNSPKLGIGMTAIKWESTAKGGAGDWVETTESDVDWYNYSTTEKKWANAKTTDGSIWVWIPRYAYQIESGWHTNSATAGIINIKFLKGTTNTATDGTKNWDNASGQGNWNVHPAFNYGSKVAGIWVAKFEASKSDATNSSVGTSSIMKIQPTVQSWRSIKVSDIYTNCLNYNTTLNSHQMKNSEWGAVAYLTQSSYGKNSEVWINNSSSYITGSAGESTSASQDTGTTNDYTSTQGVNASTTGNIYGIYDMSGGAWEYTAAYLLNNNENLRLQGLALVNGDVKTKDIYMISNNGDIQADNYLTSINNYGDAIYETSEKSNNPYSWYNDYSGFPVSKYQFFDRGGGYSSTTSAGLFDFGNNAGEASDSYGFRPVLCIM